MTVTGTIASHELTRSLNGLESLPSFLEAVPIESDDGRSFGQYLPDGRKHGIIREVIPNGDVTVASYENDELNGLCIKWSANSPSFSA